MKKNNLSASGNLQLLFLILITFLFFNQQVYAVIKTSNGNGSWSTAALWSPTGVPAAGDIVTIRTGDSLQINNNYSVSSLTINTGGVINMTASKVLTITGSLTVNGRMTMNGADIIFSSSGSAFSIGAGGSFTWEPKTNTLAMASLFTNGVESFSATSTLVIKKWYNYSVALGSVVTGNFGNLRMNSLNGSFLTEWNQNNQFQTHLVLGTLTIDQGWIVLDKSGNISNTTIGNITLLNANSYLDFHGGTHPGSFTINTANINISAGMLNGVYDGNGNVTLNVSGYVSITNSGYFYLVYNDGVSSVGNGNVTMNVTGSFTQTSGDFRGIYNLTTYSSGISTLTFSDMNLTGGIFMGHYGCHTANGTNTLTISGNLSINYTSSLAKFRAVGLSQLATTVNNVKLNFTVGGNVSTAGHANAEFFSQVASGLENVAISGNASFAGCTNSFDYGVAAAAHAFTLTISGNLDVTGGTVHLARIGGNGTTTVSGNVTITGGSLIAKADVGTITFTINGNYTQSNGTFYLHSNTTTNTTNVVNTVVNGSFTHSGGTINFDDNTSSSAATHTLTINSADYNLTGAGIITHSSAGTGSVFGMINFNRTGTTAYTRSSTSHNIQQVKQTISNGCILDIVSGNIQVASHATAGTDYFKVASGGILQMNTNQISSNGTSANSGMRVESGGLMKIKKTAGLYDGTANATVNFSNNMNFYLDANSTIEYNGTENQVITGTGPGIATTNNHKYGILNINFSGTPDVEYAYLATSSVFVRTKLNLESGELNLNNFTITIEAGGTSAISRNTGYIKSETNAAINGSIVKWMNMTTGSHIFPFGVNSSDYIPITFSPISGTGGYVSIGTRGTMTSDNTPYPGISNVGAVTNLVSSGVDVATTSVIDRWYNFDAPGFIANVILSYRGIENTTLNTFSTEQFGIQAWDGSGWSSRLGSSTGVTSGVGTVVISNASQFSPWAIVYTNTALPIELINFDANANGDIVDLNWATATEKNNDYFTIERSSDGKNFTESERIPGGGNSSKVITYKTKDYQPLSGKSYYRLKQTDFDGKFAYSKLAVVDFGNSTGIDDKQLDKITIAPNPFKNQFSLTYYLKTAEVVSIQLINANGQVVFNQQIQASAGENKYEFTDGNKITPGNYVFILIASGAKISRKIIKNM